MIRKQNRLRREYLYKKSMEIRDKQMFDKKQKLKSALAEGAKSIPSELRKDADTLRKQLAFDEAQAEISTHADDEYAYAGIRDPKILVTTSRDPSSRLQQFAKEMRLIFPNSQRINRGGHVIKEIVDACKANDVADLVILHEHRGQPDGMVVCHFPFGPTAYFSLHNVVLRHDIADQGTVSEAYPHLVFQNFTSTLGKRMSDILKFMFPVPKDDSKRVISFINQSDYISFRHHVYHKVGNTHTNSSTSSGNKDAVELAEVGPRFEMKPYQIKLGTVDIAEADNEWVYRPYMRTAKKRDFL
eukprot:Partr_v1_DN24853_c1_g1_i2_m29761 putative u3 small nucleolar ribonucleoprotein